MILQTGKQQDKALKIYLGDLMPKDLLSSEKDEQGETEPDKRYFIPVEDIEECEPGPIFLAEFNIRQFVSLFCS